MNPLSVFFEVTESLGACKTKCLAMELPCAQIEYRACDGSCNTYSSACDVDQNCGNSWVAFRYRDAIAGGVSKPRNPRHFNMFEGGRKCVSTFFIDKNSVPCTKRDTAIVSCTF